jgi:uncharacterized Zn-binding protein involved in type VI secretion
MMRQVACVGDIHICPAHGPNVVAAGGTAILDGRPVARIGDPCLCGCLIVDGAGDVLLDGRPVALLGAKTTLGGVITACAGTAVAK